MKHSYTPEKIAAMTDAGLKNLLGNARRLGAEDVVKMCEEEGAKRRYGGELPAEVSAKLEAALSAYESLKAREKGQKSFRASRTRNAISRNGLKSAVENIVMRGASMGFATLPAELTFEHAILTYPQCFPEAVVEVARNRLS
ncbi:hypothetical protein [Mesorhizobium sp. M1143]|uniref:hypothetical protein n=1 Tax=Mesorhizobium sp. M1143 TaxID=2957061 RepID=UPI00333C67BD